MSAPAIAIARSLLGHGLVKGDNCDEAIPTSIESDVYDVIDQVPWELFHTTDAREHVVEVPACAEDSGKGTCRVIFADEDDASSWYLAYVIPEPTPETEENFTYMMVGKGDEEVFACRWSVSHPEFKAHSYSWCYNRDGDGFDMDALEPNTNEPWGPRNMRVYAKLWVKLCCQVSRERFDPRDEVYIEMAEQFNTLYFEQQAHVQQLKEHYRDQLAKLGRKLELRREEHHAVTRVAETT